MDTIEITVRVNKVNAGKVKEVGTAHNGTLEDDKTAHALAETEEPAVPLAEKIIDHEILCFTFETEERAAAFVEAASEAIGVAPGIFKGMTAQRDGEKFDLPVPDKVKPPSNRGNKGLPPPPGDRRAARCRGGRCRHLEWKHPEHGAAVTPRLLSSQQRQRAAACGRDAVHADRHDANSASIPWCQAKFRGFDPKR
jgi:hypothetical protein